MKLYETLNLPAQDFSDTIVVVSVYVPPAPQGGGDYIQITLYNSSGDNVQSSAFPITFSEWNVIIFDIDTYINGTEIWGFDSTGGTPEIVYEAVTEISVKVGFGTGPNWEYYYYVDNLDWDKGSLRALASAQNILMGAAVNPALFSETGYNTILKSEFNTMVAENVMKAESIQPSEGSFSFTNGDAIITYGETNGMAIRGHALLWHSQVPSWMEATPYADLDDVLTTHINTVAGHYAGLIESRDVVNEVIKNDGTGLRNNNEADGDYSIWANSPTDDSLITMAFELAAAADPNAKLIINDYSNETMGQTKADALYNLIAGWVAADVPIDGVGFQLHLMEMYTPDYTNIRANIERYIALGLEVQFTEIDVRIEQPVTTEKLNNQAAIYANLMQIALDYPEVTTFVVWGVTDKYSWIPTFFEGFDAALLFDEDYLPKPAYDSLIETLRE